MGGFFEWGPYRDDSRHSVAFVEEVLEGIITFLSGSLALLDDFVEGHVEIEAGSGSGEDGRCWEPGVHDCLCWNQHRELRMCRRLNA